MIKWGLFLLHVCADFQLSCLDFNTFEEIDNFPIAMSSIDATEKISDPELLKDYQKHDLLLFSNQDHV